MIYEYQLKILLARKNEREIIMRTNEITIIILLYSVTSLILTVFGINIIFLWLQVPAQAKSHSFKFVLVAFLGNTLTAVAEIYRSLVKVLVKNELIDFAC